MFQKSEAGDLVGWLGSSVEYSISEPSAFAFHAHNASFVIAVFSLVIDTDRNFAVAIGMT